MTLLSIVKSVMDSNGWPAVTSSVAASQDQNMRQTMALANKALRSASFKKDWPVLIREQQFDTVGGQTDYPLPPDFHHLVAPSAWNADQYYKLKGSLPPSKWWEYALNGGINFPEGFRLDPSNGVVRIAPTPSGISNLVFMYVTNLIAKDVSGVPIPQYTQDTDVSLISEELVELGLTWRWRQKKGLDYTAEMAEYNGTFNTRYAQSLALGEIDVGGRWYYGEGYPITQPTVPPVFGP